MPGALPFSRKGRLGSAIGEAFEATVRFCGLQTHTYGVQNPEFSPTGIDRLVLLEAMWALLQEQGLSDEALAAKLMELDQSGGSLDGRRTPASPTCRSCGSKVAAGLAACQFCGTEVPSDSTPFDSL